MNHHEATASVAGAVVLIGLLAAIVVCAAVGLLRRRFALLVAAGVLGGVFQVGHFGEHFAQLGYWAGHRAEAPWMTPWADALMDSFARVAPGTTGFGVEGLHLVGNAIFLIGALAILAVVSRGGLDAARTPARITAWVQTVHVAEHVALTATVFAVGRPIGMSTMFGTLDPGPALWSYRVWWHFTINAVATALMAIAVIRQYRHDRGRGRPTVKAAALAC